MKKKMNINIMGFIDTELLNATLDEQLKREGIKGMATDIEYEMNEKNEVIANFTLMREV